MEALVVLFPVLLAAVVILGVWGEKLIDQRAALTKQELRQLQVELAELRAHLEKLGDGEMERARLHDEITFVRKLLEARPPDSTSRPPPSGR